MIDTTIEGARFPLAGGPLSSLVTCHIPDPGLAVLLLPARIRARVFPRSTQRARLFLAIIAVAVSATALGAGWRSYAMAAARRALPVLPDLAGTSPTFVQRLRAADAAARLDPRSAAALAELGGLYHANNFTGQAQTCWDLLVRLQPFNPRWPYYLADLAAIRSDDGEFARQLARTLALAPQYAPAWLAWGDFEFKRGQFAEAERAYRRRLELQPRDAYAQLGLARLALQHGDRAAAKQQLMALLRDHDNFASAHDLYAELAEADGDAETAKRQRWLGVAAGRYRTPDDPWKEALRPYCFDVDQLLVWGDIDLQTKFGARGKGYFDRAIALAPQDSAAWQKLGECFLAARDTRSARDAFARAWELPGATEVLGNELNDACLALDQPTDALEFMDEGLRRLPQSSILGNARGLDLAALGRTDEAIAAFRTASAQAANNPGPLANLGLALLQRGQEVEGRNYLLRALAVQPGFAKALTVEARLELRDRDFDSAARLVLPYFEQWPGVAEARRLMADLQLARALDANQRGDPATAEQICRQGLAAVPESAALHEFLGVQCLQRGDLDDAVRQLETAHHYDVANARCTMLLATVYMRANNERAARELLRSAADDALRSGDRAKADNFARLAANLPANP